MRTGAPAALPEMRRVSTLDFQFLTDALASVSLPDILFCPTLRQDYRGNLSKKRQDIGKDLDGLWFCVSCCGDDTHTSLFKSE